MHGLLTDQSQIAEPQIQQSTSKGPRGADTSVIIHLEHQIFQSSSDSHFNLLQPKLHIEVNQGSVLLSSFL